MTKKELVAKIAKEQGLDPKKLERMNMDQLHKMDAVVPDEDDIFGGAEEETEIPSESSDEGATDVQSSDEGATVVVETVEDVDGELESNSTESFPTTTITETKIEEDKILVGHHPITKEPVYR